jgi:hypothetical protein
MPEFDEMVARGEITGETAHLLRAIKNLDIKLDATQAAIEDDTEARIVQVEEDSRHRFRVGLAVIAVVALIIGGLTTGYAHYDRVSRCRSRADTIETIEEVLAKDHDALPAALLAGFPKSEDLDKIVAVIRSGYHQSEAELRAQLPKPDCSGLFP